MSPFRVYVVGRQTTSPISADLSKFSDPFAAFLNALDGRSMPLPQSGLELVDALRTAGPTVVRVFLVGDGFHFPAGTDVQRDMRFVVTAGDDNADTVLCVFDLWCTSKNSFLQVLAWDAAAGHFNWYLRNPGSGGKIPGAEPGEWIFNGNSWDAFTPETRGKGPFDGHVNGDVVMKERTVPWLHWVSQSDGDFAKGVPQTDDEVSTAANRLISNNLGVVSQANDLQSSIEALSSQWNHRRVQRIVDEFTQHGSSTWVAFQIRCALTQVLSTTTIEIASSTMQSQLSTDSDDVPVPVPLAHVYDVDAFESLHVDIDTKPVVDSLVIPRKHYDTTVSRLMVVMKGFLANGSPGFEQAGDAFFAIPAPVRAFGDAALVSELVRLRVCTAHFLTALLAVDFANPVYSERRAGLLQYIPSAFVDPAEFETAFVEAAKRNSDDDNSPAFEFLQWWHMSEEAIGPKVAARVIDHLTHVGKMLQTVSGVESFFEVLETRRVLFRKTPLKEFSLTLPISEQSQTRLGAKFFWVSGNIVKFDR